MAKSPTRRLGQGSMRRVPVDPDDLLEDLGYMRKGRGFTAGRLANAGTLKMVLSGGREVEAFLQMRERFLSALHSLRNPDADLLVAAYGLGDGGESLSTLRERRECYGRTIGRSVETVADREAAALGALRDQLTSGWYPGSPLPVRTPSLHNAVINEYVEIETVVRDGMWHETREHYRFLAAFDEAEYITVSCSYPGLVTALGDFTVRSRRVATGVSHDFWHKSPMRRGGTYNLSFNLKPDGSHGGERLVEVSRAFHEPTKEVRFSVRFINGVPPLAWRFSRLGPYERPGSADAHSRLDVTSDVLVAHERDLHGGLFSGIAWRWDDGNLRS